MQKTANKILKVLLPFVFTVILMMAFGISHEYSSTNISSITSTAPIYHHNRINEKIAFINDLDLLTGNDDSIDTRKHEFQPFIAFVANHFEESKTTTSTKIMDCGIYRDPLHVLPTCILLCTYRK